MKMVSRITAIGLAGVAICYLGLSGYVWYHDNKRSKQADVQASAVSENNKVLGFLREKGCDYCHTPSAELPAYYYIPGAKQLMDYDIKLDINLLTSRPCVRLCWLINPFRKAI